MDKSEEGAKEGEPEFSRFQKLARALFGVEKKDVPKHEPKKRRHPADGKNSSRE